MSSILLSIRNVTKLYGNQPVLKHINLDIHSGEIVSFLGINGAGKTTLSNIIATLHPATSGDIIFEGKSIYQQIITYRHHIGFCQQKPNLNTSLTLMENLLLAGSYYGMSLHESSKRVTELSKQFALEPYLNQKADVLSGGFKQRFMIARALMHRPKLLLFDEPTVALDPHIRRQLWETIKELKEAGTTIILTTHYLDEAEYLSDRVCLLDQGIIRLIDTPNNLKRDFKMNNLEDVFIQLIQESPIKD